VRRAILSPLTHPEAFASLGLHESLLRAVGDLGFQRPTPIQEQAIPVVLSGRDLVATAQTGTGKTAAFVLPVMHRLLEHPHGKTRVLVLCPTRELAQQVEDDIRELARHTRLRSGTVYGGVGFGAQTKALRGGADVIVATPGRLLDHMERGHADFGRLQVLILDEADRMLDMGFLPDLRRILRKLPRHRQTLLFSATMPNPILELSRECMREAVRISANPQSATPLAITHAVYPVNRGQKTRLLLEILRRTSMPSVLIFTETKQRADSLFQELTTAGYRAEVLHGDRSQRERTAALQRFREGRVPILVATDIAARGLDIEDISHVVNYDVPQTPDDYVHRIGRTARAEAEGDAFTLASPQEERELSRIEAKLGRSLPRVTLPDFPYEVPSIVVRRDGSLVGGEKPKGLAWPGRFGRRRR